MKSMIASYENTRDRMMTRIHELNDRLRVPGLQAQEREKLEARRELLTVESIELVRIIAELRRHC